jgi:hypothetical protein
MSKSIGIIDADLIRRKGHSFPNLACMKLSGYHKELGDNTELLLNYNTIDNYDLVYISKAFTDTILTGTILDESILKKTIHGGTGFFFDSAPNLPDEIEHHIPDYHLYDNWVKIMETKGLERIRLEYYKDYSIGFTTRGCFRKCEFCVNKKYDKVFFHAHVKEFFDPSRKKISLWDDNILGYSRWREVFDELIETGYPFQFKQGMDIRMMTEEKAKVISSCKYLGDYIFAFDNIEDKETIIKQLRMWRKYVNPKRRTKLYVFCGFDRNNRFDEEFWEQDITDVFERIKILMEYGCLPYIMRYKECDGPYRDVYQTIKTWCNFVPNYMKKSFRQYCIIQAEAKRNPEINALKKMEEKYPEIAKKYFDLRREDLLLDQEWK